MKYILSIELCLVFYSRKQDNGDDVLDFQSLPTHKELRQETVRYLIEYEFTVTTSIKVPHFLRHLNEEGVTCRIATENGLGRGTEQRGLNLSTVEKNIAHGRLDRTQEPDFLSLVHSTIRQLGHSKMPHIRTSQVFLINTWVSGFSKSIN